MARRKNRGNEKGQAIAKLIMEQYQPQNKDEMQEAIKDVFGPMLEAMLQDEMDNLGYDLDGIKEVFSLWISDIEGKHQPQQKSCLH